MRLIYCLMILLWPFAGTGQKIKALTIGDKIPDSKIKNVYYYPFCILYLGQFKGKLVLPDFRATSCVLITILCSLVNKNFTGRRLKKTIYAAVFFLSINTLQAQQPALKPLSIGDNMPDVELSHMTNYPTKSAKLSDFKSDLLLLDFWGTWCSACLQSFPKLDSLKRKFPSLQILLVNTKSRISKDNEPKILNTLKNLDRRTGSHIGLPVVFQNDQLDAFFPLKYIPQVAWIRKNKVIAITGSEEVTAENISSVLNEEPLHVQTKKDLLSFNDDKPLFDDGNGGQPRQILFRSLITGYIEGIGQKIGYRMQNNKIIGVFLLNQSLLNLVKDAYRDSIHYPDNRISIEVANPDYWYSKNDVHPPFFCYELVVPASSERQIKQYMQMDLKKYFDITVYSEMRKRKCLIIRRSAHSEPPTISISDTKSDLQPNTLHKYIHNRNVTSAVRLLNLYSPLPIIDESNVKETISLDLPFDLTDIKGLQNSFEKAGFTLKEEEKEIEVTVIADH